MVTVPTPFPVTIPEVPIEAIVPLLVLHVPPEVPSPKLVVDAKHVLNWPVIGNIALTVTTAVEKQPAPIV